ncbi:MAG TPA: hypothetical protein VHO84_09165 [Syntrophorhabdaceae bacterium]|nr:hypothetical protein [Syntrophorhabdaceae bacterium]HEX3007789.1 hypothetical protein [Bacteroidales bacterium]
MNGLRADMAQSLSPEMIIPPTATSIEFKATPGFERLTYQLAVGFPARDFIESLSKKVRSLGYCPLKNDWLNRNMTTSYQKGWINYIGVKSPKAPKQFISEWVSWWLNDSGDVLGCSLSYLSPSESPTNTTELRVMFQKMSKQLGAAFEEKMTSEFHQELPRTVTLPCDTNPSTGSSTDGISISDMYIYTEPSQKNKED